MSRKNDVKPGRSSAPTISEVARAAGVGRATAARTLGGYGYVSDDMRTRVLEAAEKLGYRTNALARSMSTGVSHTIGVVVGDISNPFFGGLVKGIVDTTRTRGVDAFVLSTYENLDEEVAAMEALVDKRVDGIILATTVLNPSQAAHLELTRSQGIPVVLADRTVAGINLDAVVIDNLTAARTGVEALIAQGHRRIGFIWGPSLDARPQRRRDLVAGISNDLSTVGERLLGYLDALDDAEIVFDQDLVMTGRKTEAGAAAEVERMMRLDDPPTAFFSTETEATTGTLRALRELGLNVPKDVSFVGMDDSSWATVMDPPLTMVRQPMQEIGERAAELLLERVTGNSEPITTQRLDAQLTQRGSIAAPARS